MKGAVFDDKYVFTGTKYGSHRSLQFESLYVHTNTHTRARTPFIMSAELQVPDKAYNIRHKAPAIPSTLPFFCLYLDPSPFPPY